MNGYTGFQQRSLRRALHMKTEGGVWTPRGPAYLPCWRHLSSHRTLQLTEVWWLDVTGRRPCLNLIM
jgi:hypothetical protein